MRTLSFLLIAAMLCCIVPSVQADDGVPITPSERLHIDSLMGKMDFPDSLRNYFLNMVTREVPELKYSGKSFFLTTYVHGDTLQAGVIPVSLGKTIKVWTFHNFGNYDTFWSYNDLQLVYFVDDGSIGFRTDPGWGHGWIITLVIFFLAAVTTKIFG